MKTLLFLTHRIPYPPNKGDKIRSYELLKHLHSRCRVLLGAFVDYADDWRFRPNVEALCAEVELRPLQPTLARMRSLTGLVTGRPLTIPYYRDRGMEHWVREKVAQGVDAILVFSSSMAQYVNCLDGRIPRMIDFVDLDSEKWRQYGASRGGVAGAIYRREGELLAGYEDDVARRFDHSSLVTAAETESLLQRCPDLASRVHVVSNGVDHRFFDPQTALANPYETGAKVVVFTGAMDYWANVDAACWFANEIWPPIAVADPAARFVVVGSRPTRAVQELRRLPGIRVTGTVEDVRPYLKHALVAVAPMRIARGVQNKVLEGMAMGLRVVVTPAVVRGLSAGVAANVRVADGASAFAQAVLAEFDAPSRAVTAARNRAAILEDYDWSKNLALVSDLLALDGAAARGTQP
jgi:sugar transferase (PEP-CTERM/EpsH1 system associated)